MKTYGVVMAGGGGTRLWPLSTKKMPKQFLNLSGKETLVNEAVDRLLGVAGKEEKVNDPWKDLEAQMNGMTITPPPAQKQTDDDGMTSSFDDPTAPAASAKEEKIDMSDYSSMLGGINDNMTTNTAQYDPSWDLKMMEGLNDNDDDDEMSSDNVGFFDL